jgi:hypothetical protein
MAQFTVHRAFWMLRLQVSAGLAGLLLRLGNQFVMAAPARPAVQAENYALLAKIPQ